MVFGRLAFVNRVEPAGVLGRLGQVFFLNWHLLHWSYVVEARLFKNGLGYDFEAFVETRVCTIYVHTADHSVNTKGQPVNHLLILHLLPLSKLLFHAMASQEQYEVFRFNLLNDSVA